VQQWSFGYQWGFAKDFLWDVRYGGAKGTRLLLATPLAQPWDLNHPNVPDVVFQRFVDAYLAAGSPRGPLNPGATAREQGTGVAFGFTNPLTGQLDLNLSSGCTSATLSACLIIPFEARAPFLGLNAPEALILQSRGRSIYHSLQTSVVKRFSRGLQFNLSYTWSKSIDDFSQDPGSTAGGGKPDVPNVGFQIQGDTNNLRANRAVSDFDRPHRVSLSFVYDIPSGGHNNRWVKGWQISGFFQAQSGTPYTIFTSEPELANLSQASSLARSGGLYRLAFGRPSLAPGATLSQLCSSAPDVSEAAFQTSALAAPPVNGFGNLGRNTCRGDVQKRVDFAISKTTRISESTRLEFRAEFFNIFNLVNFALPVNDLQDSSNIAQIENTVGGPRVIQFGLRFSF
jgi:hypothetical protein